MEREEPPRPLLFQSGSNQHCTESRKDLITWVDTKCNIKSNNLGNLFTALSNPSGTSPAILPLGRRSVLFNCFDFPFIYPHWTRSLKYPVWEKSLIHVFLFAQQNVVFVVSFFDLHALTYQSKNRDISTHAHT